MKIQGLCPTTTSLLPTTLFLCPWQVKISVGTCCHLKAVLWDAHPCFPWMIFVSPSAPLRSHGEQHHLLFFFSLPMYRSPYFKKKTYLYFSAFCLILTLSQRHTRGQTSAPVCIACSFCFQQLTVTGDTGNFIHVFIRAWASLLWLLCFLWYCK